jgi:hypothetical protein
MTKLAQLETYLATLNIDGLFKFNSYQQLEGSEGRELTKKIHEVSRSLSQAESIQRILKSAEQTNKSQHQELQHYLQQLRREATSKNQSEFTASVIDLSESVWADLRSHFQNQQVCLEVPDACPGHHNNLMYTWSKGDHYLECELFGTGEIEFFYRNRSTGDNWAEDTTLEHGFSTAIFEQLARFAW